MKVVGSVRAGRVLSAVGLVLAMGVGGVACGGSDEKTGEDTFVGAEEVCDGLFAGPLASKVQSVTGDAEFFATGAKGLDNVVEALKRGHASGRSWATGAELCPLSPKGAAAGDSGGIKFSMYAPRDVEDPRTSADTESYDMGEKAESRPAGASLYFECASPQVKGSDERPLRIFGSFGRGKSDAADTPASRAANLEILHAASLSVVKKLDCENDGGLPKTPVLTPK
ncbi:hypothetical protein EES45_21550 [Streptomyces sp. ADI97-07]|uniref:hypothetical protein n=1 Tax=Streptomyces sp. ADI97-07 TaxID=1522762 RepID=UPI000F5593B9|nr:hypothetical protein [Streptomyces sp. ADI97-07]RPK77262.1 hypothetical protein EES45_21550 [Streptomyces sp. ADI97-07]